MSIAIMSIVWDAPLDSHTEKIVLLSLADHANDLGQCWPSISTLAKKCSLSRQGVIKVLSKLEGKGLLERGRGIGKSNRYTIIIAPKGLPTPVNPVDYHQSTTLTTASKPRGLVNPVDQSTLLTTPVNPVDYHQSTTLTKLVNVVDPNHKEPSIEPSGNHRAGESISERKPRTDLSQLASRIAGLVPEWSPHFSHIERVNLVDNLGKWEGLTESDWRTLKAWYADNTEASKFRAGKAKLLESPDEEVVKSRRAGFSASAVKAKRKTAAPEGWQAVYAGLDPDPLIVDGEYAAPEWERLTPSEQSEVVGRMAANPTGLPQNRVSTPEQGKDSGLSANPPQNRNQSEVA